MNIIENNAFTALPKFQHLNRFSGRKATNEINKINSLLAPVIGNFYKELFSGLYEYKDLYEHYLKAYNQRVSYINSSQKFVCWRVYDRFFLDNFKPLELPPSSLA